jgi:hypothetical protein
MIKNLLKRNDNLYFSPKYELGGAKKRDGK